MDFFLGSVWKAARYFSISFYKSETYNFLVERIRKPCDAKKESMNYMAFARFSFKFIHIALFDYIFIVSTTL